LNISTFTLDTNCIIDVEEGRAPAEAIRRLADAHAKGQADVAVGAIMASEKQRMGQLENFSQFKGRLSALRLGHLNILPAMFYWDVTFFDHSFEPDDASIKLEKHIHNILFPALKFLWSEYCEDPEVPVGNQLPNSRWKNAKCDVQSMWTHIYHERFIFVTSDGNFHKTSKKVALASLGSGKILFPEEAAKFIDVP
jgi:hypothetical protein